MPNSAQPRPIWRLVEESLSEAGFLWTRLDQALNAADHTLADVERWVERRLVGAFDGVRVAGTSALSPLLEEALADSDAGSVGAAAYLLSSIGSSEALELLERSLMQLPAERVSLVARGLGRARNVEAMRALWARLRGSSSTGGACLLEALAFCGETPDADWKALLTSDDDSLRRAAASSLRCLTSSQRAEVMWVAMQSSDPAVRVRGTIAGLIAGDSAAWHRCCEHLGERHTSPASAAAMLVVAMLGTSREQASVCEALLVPELKREALHALSYAGSCDAVDACLSQAREGEDKELAYAAIVEITGVDLATLSVAARTPVADASSESEPPSLQLPEFDAVEQWWKTERRRFDPRGRYRRGKLKTLSGLKAELREGPTQRRHAVALEVAVRSRGAHRVQTMGFCGQQRREMLQLEAFSARELHEASAGLGVEPLLEG